MTHPEIHKKKVKVRKKIRNKKKNWVNKILKKEKKEVVQNCLSCPEITLPKRGGGPAMDRQTTDIAEWQVESLLAAARCDWKQQHRRRPSDTWRQMLSKRKTCDCMFFLCSLLNMSRKQPARKKLKQSTILEGFRRQSADKETDLAKDFAKKRKSEGESGECQSYLRRSIWVHKEQAHFVLGQ